MTIPKGWYIHKVYPVCSNHFTDQKNPFIQYVIVSCDPTNPTKLNRFLELKDN